MVHAATRARWEREGDGARFPAQGAWEIAEAP